MRVVIIGRPASGKSTLTDNLLARDPALRSFGVRRHFAREVERATPTGLLVADRVAANQWLPDDVVVGAVRDLLASGELGDDFVLEGMPGNAAQADLLDTLLAEWQRPLDGVVWVDTPEDFCRARAGGRLVCYRCDGGSHEARRRPGSRCCAQCGGAVTPRTADAEEVVGRRLEAYRTQSRELLAHYGARVVRVDGRTEPADVLAQAVAGLDTNVRLGAPA